MGENDAHPLTDEQLDALVDELQDRLGDSTARKVGRRGVLAALGLATLGTGSASAQASGSVGTASSPVDVFGYDVDASNSFTDPAGVQHTGELADISDVGSGTGQWQEVNSGSNIEPIDGETIGTGSEDVDVGSVNTSDLSGTYPGKVRVFANNEIISTIDPANTTSPVQDACDDIDAVTANGSGKIILPEGTVQDSSGSIPQLADRKMVLGHGIDSSRIEFTDTSDDGVVLNPAGGTSRTFWHGFTLDGTDSSTRGSTPADQSGGTAAIRATGNAWQFSMGQVKFNNWGDVVYFESNGPFGAHWNDISMTQNEGAGLIMDGGGPAFSIGSFDFENNGANYAIRQNRNTRPGACLKVGMLNYGNAGGSACARLDDTRRGYAFIDYINYEPTDTTTSTYAVRLLSEATAGFRCLQLRGNANVDFGVEHRSGAGNKYIGRVENLATINTNKVRIQGTASGTDKPSFYYGPQSDITDNSTGSTGAVRSMASAGTGNG